MKKKAGQPSVRHEASEVRSNQLAPVPANRSVEPLQFEEVPVETVLSDEEFYKSLASSKPSKSSSKSLAVSTDNKKPVAKASSSKSSGKSSKSSKSSKGSSKGAKKNPTGIVIAIVAAVLLIGGGVFAGLYYTGFFKPDIDVTLADGTVSTIKADQAFAELTADKFFAGTVVDGVDLGGKTMEEAYAVLSANQTELPVTIDVKLDLEGKKLNLDFSNAEFAYNTQEVLNEAFAKFRPVDPDDLVALVECYNNVQQLQNAPQTYETAFTIQIDGVSEKVHKVLDFYIEDYAVCQDAAIVDFDTDAKTFTVTPEKVGYKIDADATAAAVKALFDSKTYVGVVKVPTEVSQPKVTAEMINNEFGLVGECSTKCSSNSNRNNNISQACKNMNGTILQPGEVFSFNDTVGERTSDNGFREATVIQGGQYEQGLGGGICQASSTLYNAVLKANLKVVDRSHHAWPSDYVPVGLDATVDWGNLDFKFENDSDFQVIVVTWFDWDESRVHAEIYGKKLPDGKTISLESEIISTSGYGPTEYVEDKSLATGQKKTLRQAHQGKTARAYKIWKDAEGNEISREEYNTTTYNAYGERIAIGTLNPDGTYATFDKSTGEYTSPVASPTPTAGPTATPTPPQAANPTPTTEPPPPTPTPEPPPPTPTPEPPPPENPPAGDPDPGEPDPNNGG